MKLRTEANMPGNPRECRLSAMRCLQLAKDAKNQSVKDNFVSLAGTWQALANQLAAQQALIEKIADDDSNRQSAGASPAVRADTGC
jgi:hypothetical protein